MTDMPDSLAAALAQLQADLPTIEKTERAEMQTTRGNYSYTYADLATITGKIMPLLGKFGLSFIAKPSYSGDRFVLAYSLLHISGQRENGEYPLPTSGTPQAVGSAITYGRRYCLCAVTGVAPGDDDDAAAASTEAESNRGSAQRRPRQRQQQKPAQQGQHAQRTQTARQAPPLPSDESSDAKLTDGQRAKMHATFNDLGVTDRDKRLTITSTAIGRTITTANELTRDEAATLIDRLEQITRLDEEDKPLVLADMAGQNGEST